MQIRNTGKSPIYVHGNPTPIGVGEVYDVPDEHVEEFEKELARDAKSAQSIERVGATQSPDPSKRATPEQEAKARAAFNDELAKPDDRATIRNVSAHPIYVHGRTTPLPPGETHDVAHADRDAIEEQLRRESLAGATKTIEVVHESEDDHDDSHFGIDAQGNRGKLGRNNSPID